ncbi:hypothetical protein RE428_49060 (plasmid) [Marinobacter nanhaiticus D15-8W]|nr:hypothetical protein RE428_49060 [Marinobacter nanhaiticus D15-8W]
MPIHEVPKAISEATFRTHREKYEVVICMARYSNASVNKSAWSKISQANETGSPPAKFHFYKPGTMFGATKPFIAARTRLTIAKSG